MKLYPRGSYTHEEFESSANVTSIALSSTFWILYYVETTKLVSEFQLTLMKVR